MKKIIISISLILIIILSLVFKPKEEKKVSISYKEKEMLSYTIDGKETKEKPSKDGNYIANKIECEKNTNIVWDNTNWQVEIKNIESEDICNIDFTSDVNTEGYRVTINSNDNSSMDSLSKSTIKGGRVEFESTNRIINVSGCNGKIVDGRLVIENVISNQTCTLNIIETLYNRLLSDNLTHTGSRPGAFSSVYTADNTGVMYVASGNQTEDGSNVYYFAGNAKNNWVRFGKDSNGSDLYWRIIRTNEDGSVRMLYAGTSPDTTAGYINASQAYNGTYNNPMYVGYMYGSSGSLANNRTNTTNSPIKTVVDNWYASGLNTKTDASGNKYDAYISETAMYCNDRAHEGTYSTSSTFYYGAYYRLESNKAPSYKCGNNASGSLYSTASSADKFSKSTSKGGNGKLQYPVALMTADEVSFAGGVWVTNAPTWYYYNSGSESITGSIWWWTMSPYDFYNGYAYVFYVRGSSDPGYLYDYNVDYTHGVRPVISLKSCTTWKNGNGSSSTPYEVELNNSCALSEN